MEIGDTCLWDTCALFSAMECLKCDIMNMYLLKKKLRKSLEIMKKYGFFYCVSQCTSLCSGRPLKFLLDMRMRSQGFSGPN